MTTDSYFSIKDLTTSHISNHYFQFQFILRGIYLRRSSYSTIWKDTVISSNSIDNEQVRFDRLICSLIPDLPGLSPETIGEIHGKWTRTLPVFWCWNNREEPNNYAHQLSHRDSTLTTLGKSKEKCSVETKLVNYALWHTMLMAFDTGKARG